MTDFEQPDSTTMPEVEQEPAVANDLISLGDEAEAKPTEQPSSPVKEDPKPISPVKEEKKITSPIKEKKTVCTEEDLCPLVELAEHVGTVVPSPLFDIMIWKDMYKTAVIFFTILPLMISYSYCNPIVVSAYLLLGLVVSTTTYRVYRYVLDSFQKSVIVHPFKDISDLEEEHSRQMVLEWVDRVLPIFINGANKIKHFILVEDIVDTVKFAVALYITAVIGGFFSLRVLFILAFVGAFTLPKGYSMHKSEVDTFMHKSHGKFMTQVRIAKQKVFALKDQAMNAAAKKRN